ncbi:MAG TPA: 6-hydroxymethylpterin diphosphokinase MptE-like protein [Thermoplasmata archaeon]|nr:6-hydroxymethylpterin diphosphokinase MptE-like protein [Thermoplasmata archaeon]
MEYASWAPRYEEIRREFGFPFDREERSARLLRSLLPEAALDDPLRRISERVRGRETIVVGLGPGAGAPPLWTRSTRAGRPAVVAADGATQPCLDAGIVPDVVVTDLDGPVASEVTACVRGSLVVIHAHGDNADALARWVPEFSGELAGSWAGPPADGLLDVGGFTDGDRAAYLADHVGAARILLWGFDFTQPEESEPDARVRKLAKLRWAARLLGELSGAGRTPVEEWRRDGSLRPYPAGPIGPATQ